MSNKTEKYISFLPDIRVVATSRILGIAAGMLAISIPLSDKTNSGAILS